MENKKIKVIFDVDTGVDDAIAIILAIASNNLDILFFCSSSGNTSAKNGAKNTLNILSYINAPNIPVVVGCERKIQALVDVTKIHGNNGIGDYKFPKHNRKIDKTNYIDKYIETLENSEDKVDIFVLGPITNLANVLKQKPSVKEKINRVVFMASSISLYEKQRNYAGFNVACDPDAADFVFSQKLDIILCPTEIGHSVTLSNKELEIMRKTNQLGQTLYDILDNYHDRQIHVGKPMYDSSVVFAMANFKKTEIKPVNVEVRYYKKFNTGIAISDFNKKPNMKIITKIQKRKFKKTLYEMLLLFNKK